ncbi:MAG TPA: HD domain-containing protein [Acidimicrobiales bacterium]|nr:HD domain-containing protein [Acidimicrobiales bacterium]
MNTRFGPIGHLARRFFTSLWPGGPPAADDRWARSFLADREVALWEQMSGPDRRHAVAVARRLGPVEPVAVPAALLHDVGKVESRLGPLRRAIVTVAALAAGRDRLAAGSGRAARYLRHDALGADLLAGAGSDRLTVTWAREHHLPPERWTVPAPLGRALKAADDD